MKNIVATIQRDQNAIIRDADARVLIIQGVAGSGKTSIALHRIAFLLYRFRETLTSSDILIISPNRVFGDYISNVLPELGEESVGEIGMETLASELLGGKVRFQSFFEQTDDLLQRDDPALRRRIEVKSSPAFLETLDEYAAHVERTSFCAEDLWIARYPVPGWFIDETFSRHKSVGLTERIARVVAAIVQNMGIHYNYEATTEDRQAIRKSVRNMVRKSTLRATYQQLFDWMGEPELFKTARAGRLEYADVFPLVYLKMRIEGIESEFRQVKHLLIDEMQDYTPVQYAVISRLFGCPKTILGDTAQSVNPHSASSAEAIQAVFKQASFVKLVKSYRSTYEITRFSQRISPNPELIAIERHGEEPSVLGCRTAAREREEVRRLAAEFVNSGHRTLAVICRTQRQAERMSVMLREAGHQPTLLSSASRSFSPGIIVCTAHMAKGLEFDQVIVPDASAKNYRTVMDRNLLYVACTRAMHRLALTVVGQPSPFLPAERPER